MRGVTTPVFVCCSKAPSHNAQVLQRCLKIARCDSAKYFPPNRFSIFNILIPRRAQMG